MNASEFVANWKRTKDELLETFIDNESESDVVTKIASMRLMPEQSNIMRSVLDSVLTDAFYTLLLGFDGTASIGGIQQPYQIRDESGNLISECGDLEAEAWEQFHGDGATSEALTSPWRNEGVDRE